MEDFTPRMLIPSPLYTYLPHHLTTLPAPGGLYVEAPYPILLKLYAKLSRLSDAIIFPEPERQYLLLHGKKPFTKGLLPTFNSLDDAFFYLLFTRRYINPAYTFLENILFLEGYARSLRRISRLPANEMLYLPLFHFNTEDSVIHREGDILLLSSLVKVRGYLEFSSLRGEEITIDGEGIVTLADALLYGLPYSLYEPLYSSKTPSPLLSHIAHLFSYLKLYLHSNLDESTLLLIKAAHSILTSLPSILLNTLFLGERGRDTLLLSYRLRERNPKLYNDLVDDRVTCYPDLRGRVSSLPALFKLLTEHLPS